mmetsp:Transcript_5941/g.9474  ORF Transcript_5941/g.9474 Transcript_5941/m.9474 type:complete len:456 (-) Transcript_5941:87-1454(-)
MMATISSLSLLLSAFISHSAAVASCRYQSASFELNEVQIWPGLGLNWFCPLPATDYSCGSLRWEGDVSFDDGTTTSFTYATEAKSCVHEDVCGAFAGGESGCEYASYTYDVWRPRSCDAANDFDALIATHDVNLYATCCNETVNCNVDVTYDAAACEEEDSFSTYMVELNTCWNEVKRTFMEDLLCDAERGDILTYSEDCLQTDGTWKYSPANAGDSTVQNTDDDNDCSYRVSCAAEMRVLLTDFAQCACTSATSNGYSGNFIGTTMAVNWEIFCPNIEISCAPEGTLSVIYNYWYVRYKFRVAVAKALITEAVTFKIRARIAYLLFLADNSDTVVVEEDATTRRRLQADDSTEGYFQITLNSENKQAAQQIQTAVGATTIVDELSALLETELGTPVTVDTTSASAVTDASVTSTSDFGTTTSTTSTTVTQEKSKAERWGVVIAIAIASIYGLIV